MKKTSYFWLTTALIVLALLMGTMGYYGVKPTHAFPIMFLVAIVLGIGSAELDIRREKKLNSK